MEVFMLAFYHIFLLFLSSYVIWKVCDSFQLASIFIGKNMPNGTRGATINAIGSSIPEFLTSLIAIFKYSDVNGALFGIANTTGSVIYNITIIPFFVIISCYIFKNVERINFNKRILFRDGIFLIFTQIALTKILETGVFTYISSFCLVFIYIIYLFILFKFSIGEKQFEQSNTKLQHSKSLLVNILNINLFSLLFPHKKEITKFNSVVILTFCIILFYFMCHILVSSSYAIGDILHIPSYIVAITLTAIATSVPDTILSVKDAKINEFDESITNVFGSNIFNISFCIGAPMLLYNVVYSTDIFLGQESVSAINHFKYLSIIYIVISMILLSTKTKKYWKTKALFFVILYAIFLYLLIMKIQP